MELSQIDCHAISKKSGIHIRKPIVSSHLQFELDYLKDDSREYLLEWYPLYIEDVAVPPPLSRFLSKQEKRDRLELIHLALSDNTKSVYTISVASLLSMLCMSLFVFVLITGILFLVWKRKQYVWLIVWLYILI